MSLHLTRRQFLLVAGGLAGASVATASALAATQHPWTAVLGQRDKPQPSAPGILVLLTLYGGNDGLNTLIPTADQRYLALRPTLRYQPHEVLPLADGLALHPNLTGLGALWTRGQLAIVRGVGYPSPVLSHFRSMDIWQSGSPEAAVDSGWLGRWLDRTGTDPMRALSVGNTLPLALTGTTQAGTAISAGGVNIPGGGRLLPTIAALDAPGPDRRGLAARVASSGSDLLAVQHALSDLLKGAGGLAGGGGGAGGGGRGGGLAAQLDLVARLIKAGSPTRVYHVSLGGFDNHAQEKATHATLMKELDSGISSFMASMGTDRRANGVVLMAYSEFGRRPAENASNGTDHGTAAPVLLVGARVKGGRFYGEEPSLSALDNGNLKFTTDFRSVYATVLSDVLGVDPKVALSGRFPTLAVF